MYARVTTTQFSPYRLDEAIHIVREHTLPAAQQQTGFKGYLMLVDRSTGKGITITLWEEEADREVTGPTSSYYRDALAGWCHYWKRLHRSKILKSLLTYRGTLRCILPAMKGGDDGV